MGRTVLLHHQLPDGSSHFDWLMERPDSDRLISFRVGERIDTLVGGSAAGGEVRRFAAEAMPDHRREYLEYEGPISGGRGMVSRVAAGSADWVMRSADAIAVILDFGSGRRRAEGRRSGVGPADSPETGAVRWEFTLVPLEPTRSAR